MPGGVDFSIPATNGSSGHASTQTSLFVHVPSSPSADTTIFDYNLDSGNYYRLRLSATRHLVLEFSLTSYGSASADLGILAVNTWTWVSCGFSTAGGLYIRGDVTPYGGATVTTSALASSGSATGTTQSAVPFGLGVSMTSSYLAFPDNAGAGWLGSKLIQTQIAANAAAGNPEPMPNVDFAPAADYREYLAHDALGAASVLTDSGTGGIDLFAGSQGLTIVDDGPPLLPSSPGPGGAHEGDLSYFHSGTWQTLAVGSTGQALIIASGDPAWGSIPQTTVEADLVEASTNDTLTGASRLLNNLNKIRYQLAQLGTGAWNTLVAMVQLSPISQQTGTINVSGQVQGAAFKAEGLTGATQASRYVGATTSGAPVSGTFAVGDYVIDRTGTVWICTTAGTPGTWTQPSGGGGSGTVTSVALTMPPEFSVAGSPITGAGTLAVTKASESANQIFSGPTTGAAAAPTFRAMVSADLPSAPTVSGEVTGSDFKAAGLTGATAASRYVGGTASGAPTSGTFAVGDFVIDQTGKAWVCTVAGTPGTWTQLAGGSSTLAADTDVSIASPVGGQVLGYSSALSKWVNQNQAGVAATTQMAVLSSDLTLTSANTYYDALTLSLSPGIWLLLANLTFENPSATGADFDAKLWDGTIIYNSSESSDGTTFNRQVMALSAIVTPGTTTSYKVSVRADQAGGWLKATGATDTGATRTSQLIAIQLSGNPVGQQAPAVKASNTANISISNAVTTYLTFDTTEYDRGTSTPQHSTSSNTGRLTCQQAGLYQIDSQIELAQNGTGQREAVLRLNGTTIIGSDYRPASSVDSTILRISLQYPLAVGDYVEVGVWQTSGGALNVNATNSGPPLFSMARIDSGSSTVLQVTTQTANYTIPSIQTLTIVGAASKTMTLPTAVNAGGQSCIVKNNGSATATTVVTTASQTIDGASTYSLVAANESATFVSDGSNWYVV